MPSATVSPRPRSCTAWGTCTSTGGGGGDLARAEHAYRRATEEDPHHASAHHNLGVVYRRQGKIPQSVKMLKKARWLDVRYPRTGEVPPLQKALRRRWARPAILLLLVLVSVVLVVWLGGRS